MLLPIFESFANKEIVAGYSLASFDWWVDIFVILGAILILGSIYFFLVWDFGFWRFNQDDKEAFQKYRQASKKEKKQIAKASKGRVKRVIVWKRMKPWFIPTISFVLIVTLVAVPVLHAIWDVLGTTINGSPVDISDTETSRKTAAQAEENVVTIEEEGLVLLKNENNTLPLKANGNEKIKINIFGSCAYGLFYGNGGSGSFQTDGRVSSFPRTALKLEKALENEGFEINQNLFNMIKNYYESEGKTISVKESTYDIQCGYNKYKYSEIVNSKDPCSYEPPATAYTEKIFNELGGVSLLENAKSFSDVAIFCITRRGSEDEDMKYSELALKQNEIDAIKLLENNFGTVIILLNVPTVIEASFLNDEQIDAAIYMGHPGLTGTKAVAQALIGKINPSGHLVDTWPYDVKSAPSYQSFGNDTTLQYTTGVAKGQSFVNYNEGIYVGYRYYVTRAKVDPTFIYEDYVQYSFGHGLSYTTFDKSIAGVIIDEGTRTIKIDVEVKNTGNVPGKEVVQIYAHVPYTPGGIEKSWYSLSAFAKTNIIQPLQSEMCQLTINYRDLASWSTEKGHYVLEQGDYELSLRENVWDIAKTDAAGRENTIVFTVGQDVKYEYSYETGVRYQNIFQDVEWGGCEERITYLSRNNFAGTWKNKDDLNRDSFTNESKFPGGSANKTSGRSFNFSDNQLEGKKPTTGANYGLTLSDLKNADWDDVNWEYLLDQLSVNDLITLVDQGSFKTAQIDSIGKKATVDYDGPSAAFHSGTGHPSEVIVACSWNVDIARMMGESIGKEGAARGLTGWYAPGINTHRSPFGGRNFEYYSEDPLIAGLMAGNTAQGSMKYGVYTYAKHFILNEQERYRSGIFTWANEQSIREIYARGFEIYVNMGGIGIMSSFNCIGSWWAGASKALLTTLLREEWGFHGVVVTDYAGPDYMATNIGLRAGNDLWLNKASVSASDTYEATKNDGLLLLRRAAKNILYACAHSNNVWTLEDYQKVGIDEVAQTKS